MLAFINHLSTFKKLTSTLTITGSLAVSLWGFWSWLDARFVPRSVFASELAPLQQKMNETQLDVLQNHRYQLQRDIRHLELMKKRSPVEDEYLDRLRDQLRQVDQRIRDIRRSSR